jgi:hypothetical protein
MWTKSENYKVTDGIPVFWYEMNTEYTDYADASHYTLKYSYTVPEDDVFITDDEYEYSLTDSSYHYEATHILDGVNERTIGHYTGEYTEKYDYTDDAKEDTEETVKHESISDNTAVYDSDTRLTKKLTHKLTETKNGEKTFTEREDIYAIELLSEADGVKRYKYYLTGDSPFSVSKFGYSEHTIKDGVTTVISAYNTKEEVYRTDTYTFPDAPVIRERLPAYTLKTHTDHRYPDSSSYQTCEVLASTDSVLKIRKKTFNTSTGELRAQTDNTYTKM